ncbi:MAG: LLM class flavin-dependent oxidoreductase, partial [Chloroflexi bacterium]|nr:LLM class flavin-dependent oxidoreductase [Chloroflexota bacterium]
MSMRLSLFHLAESPSPEGDRATMDAIVRQSLIADEAGFAAIFLPEHHFGYYSAYGNNFIMAAYLAPQIKHAYLGFAIVSLPLHHPVRIVEQMNLVDQLTRGRAIFGMGTGTSPLEAIGLGVEPSDQAGSMFDDAMDVMNRLWAKDSPDTDPVEFDTGYYRGRVFQRVMPSSHTQPRPIL